ncbi:starch synthase (maltosyl-transferring) [Frondihabitans australicus]|uniref:Alpha-1,4-glucan:maltose-1-phosphate maltosyltransferase n=1 Tax=Frondihabitans australicus TaxID=386892 RepID=A0A495ICP3_9MICO|nr:alpha-1,4-glucan--maltose-1-phosphate maltosyltransferase [Frondihabitans australicus]RKR73712.1 starch synthase (maltosyl-transferring) [Frondihabitans australicus]
MVTREQSRVGQSPARTITGRIPIAGLRPRTPDDAFDTKAFVGEVVPFEATVFREGHDVIDAAIVVTEPTGAVRRQRMTAGIPGTDLWSTEWLFEAEGTYTWQVEAWTDDWATWLHTAEIKIPAGQDIDNVLASGRLLLERASKRDSSNALLADAARALGNAALSPQARLKVATDSRLNAAIFARPLASLITQSAKKHVRVERSRAAVGNWYEFFPRSEGAKKRDDGSWQSGTFRTAAKRLPAIARMGFDVVYIPPVHPIGRTFRKGPNNTLDAGPNDPGSPYAIGSADGGHDAVHPELGTLADFEWFVGAAKNVGLELALDLALQCSPDHPWVTEHPEWFTALPDGTIAYAENPPKKYQDIYPLNFDNDYEGLSREILRIVRFWIDRGVTIFRVDNPHTKPVHFWEWLLEDIRSDHPEVVFLAEAFTKPAMMQALAQVGFQQSYTYFTWRNEKWELEEYLHEISKVTSPWFRPNFFVNTHDILTPYLQYGGVPAYKIRAAIAATASPTWGVYSGYELIENVARPGSEENIDNEKYEFKPRDWAGEEAAGASIAPYLTQLNRIRGAHPALRQLRNLTVHSSDDDAILVYSKYLDGRHIRSGRSDAIIVVVNTDPHSARDTTVHLDLRAIGLEPGSRFTVRDLITQQSWTWTDDDYVRLDSFVEPAHILSVDYNRAP